METGKYAYQPVNTTGAFLPRRIPGHEESEELTVGPFMRDHSGDSVHARVHPQAQDPTTR